MIDYEDIEGDSSKFLESKKHIGFPAYTFQEICEYMGYKFAVTTANGYRINFKFNNCLLVRDYMKIHGDSIWIKVKLGEIFSVIVGKDGKLQSGQSYKEWLADLCNQQDFPIKDVQRTFRYIFFKEKPSGIPY